MQVDPRFGFVRVQRGPQRELPPNYIQRLAFATTFKPPQHLVRSAGACVHVPPRQTLQPLASISHIDGVLSDTSAPHNTSLIASHVDALARSRDHGSSGRSATSRDYPIPTHVYEWEYRVEVITSALASRREGADGAVDSGRGR